VFDFRKTVHGDVHVPEIAERPLVRDHLLATESRGIEVTGCEAQADTRIRECDS
jgi:hypothetical protein